MGRPKHFFAGIALLLFCCGLFLPPASASPQEPLRYWFWWEASSFDTYRGDAFDVMQVARNIYAPLISIGMDGKPQGMIAEDWRVDAAGTTWRFRLRKGLVFENGAPISPAVILLNFRRMLWLTRGEGLPLNTLMPETDRWKDYRAPLKCLFIDKGDLVFKFKKRPDNLFEMLSHPIYGIASPECFDDGGQWREPFCSVASGPYRVIERLPGRIKLVARHVFSGAENAPETVEIRTPVRSGESALNALLAGKGELAIEPRFALSSGTLRRIEERGLGITEEPPSRMYFLQLNHNKPPFDNKALRQSIRDMFLNLFREECALRGKPWMEPSFMPRGGVGYGLFKIPGNNAPRRSSRMAVDIVFFPLAAYSFPEDRLMQELTEAAFLKTLEAHGLVPRVERYLNRKGAMSRFVAGDFSAILRGSGVTVNDPYSGLKMMFMSKISARIPDPSGKASEYIAEANESSDPAARKGLVEKMNKSVFEDAAVIPVAHSSWVYIHKPGVDMSRFNLFMDPIEFRAIGWQPQKDGDHVRK